MTVTQGLVIPAPPSAKAVDIEDSQLVSLKFGGAQGAVKVQGGYSASDIVAQNTRTYGAICYAVRRPGCGLCREEGGVLKAIGTLPDKTLEGFGLFGVVKETGVDDAGLAEFYSKYFPYPLYRDDDKVFYKALGNRKMKMKMRNPVSAVAEGKKIVKRLSQKNISTNFKGEGFLQGGLILFDTNGKMQYVYQERTGKELPVDDILRALDEMRKGG